jgi:hypothetical protein
MATTLTITLGVIPGSRDGMTLYGGLAGGVVGSRIDTLAFGATGTTHPGGNRGVTGGDVCLAS